IRAGSGPPRSPPMAEPFVFLFRGPLAVCGTELLQAGPASVAGAVASLPGGLLAAAILLVNNVRDVDGDRRAGKRTVVVRIGRRAGRTLYAGTVAAAFAIVAVGAVALSSAAPLAAWLSAPLAAPPLRPALPSRARPPLHPPLPSPPPL